MRPGMPSGRRCLAAVLLLTLASLTSATSVYPPATRPGSPRCPDACMSSVAAMHFTDEDPSLGFRTRVCGGSLLRTSYYLCMRMQCIGERASEAAEAVRQTCRGAMGVEYPGMESVAGYTDEELAAVTRFGPDGVEGREEGRRLDEVAVPDDEYFGLWFDTLEASHYIDGNHRAYGWAMGFFWAGVVAVGMVNRAAGAWQQSRTPGMARESSPWRLVKRTLGVPATFGGRRAQSYGVWATVPPRVESVTIALFVVLNVVLSSVGYVFFPGNLYYPNVRDQVLRWVADRTGIMSFANFPLIWLFGMRNNVVLWLTGWDFATFNSFHRWVARVATVQAVIHSVLYTLLILYMGGWSYFLTWWSMLFWWTGEVATVALCALMGFSVYWLRRKQYELFLVMHIALSIVVLVTMLGHVSIFEGQYDSLVWAPVLIWLLDRACRAWRVLRFKARFWDTRARATYSEATNMVRLEVPCPARSPGAAPGTYYYLMVLNSLQFWESHPFTVASTTRRGAGEKGRDVDVDEGAPLLEHSDDGIDDSGLPGSTPSLSAGEPGTPGEDSMTFLIRPYDSFTARLRDAAAAAWPKAARLRVAVEGPYGHTQPLERYDGVCFVVGGSGVVVPLSYLRTLTGTSSTRTRRVHVHWAAREPALADEVLRRDFGEALDMDGEGQRLRVDVYLTSGGAADETASMTSAAAADDDGKTVRYHQGRMDVARVVGRACEEARGSLAVVACGPAQVADAARRAVVEAMAGSSVRVDYFEESFTW